MKKNLSLIVSILMLLTVPFFAAAENADNFSVSDTVDTADRYQVWAQMKIRSMTLAEKIGQMFIVCPEDLTGELYTQEISAEFLSVLKKYPVGGVRIFGQNIASEKQLTEFIFSMQEAAQKNNGIPLLIAAEEEGGSICTVANKLGKIACDSAKSLGDRGSADELSKCAESISEYLGKLGFNMNLSPVADVRTSWENEELIDRMFSDDPFKTAEAAAIVTGIYQKNQIIPVLKHFPGHGSLSGSAHSGKHHINPSLSEMQNCEWIPYREGIKQNAPCIMVSNLKAPELDEKNPVFMSSYILNTLLREQMQFGGVIMTDSLRQKIVKQEYSAEEAAVNAVKAGADILYLPDHFTEAFEGILDAVRSGEISEERIDSSVQRILAMKLQYGLISE